MTHDADQLARYASGVKLAPFNHVPWYSPRIWHGMSTSVFGKLIAEYRYQVDQQRMHIAAGAYMTSVVPPITNYVQSKLFEKKAQALPLVQDPIIVIGHWRSGTTYLHELLTLDDRFESPTTFQCFNPLAFMTAAWLVKPLTSFLLPTRRPMDNMDMSWEVPQEDEFALLTMGLPTTYRRIAFPNRIARHLDYLHMGCVPKPEIERWKAGLMRFVKYLNYYYRKPIVLKSPPHTGRIKILLEMFPNAKFIHITRNPFKFIPSTIHMWAALDHSNGFQEPTNENLRDYVFTSFERLYHGFNRDRHLVGPHNFMNIRFEELMSDTESVVRRLYNQLDLGDYANVESALKARLEQDRNYKKNKHVLTDDLTDEIRQRCSNYINQFGYAMETAAA
jgi:hypothetical protein